MSKLLERTYHIHLVYHVNVDDSALEQQWDKEQAKRLLQATLHAGENTLSTIILREIAFQLADMGESEGIELLTDYNLEDYSFLQATLEHLSDEDREQFDTSYSTLECIEGAFHVELDHLHVNFANKQPAEAEQPPPKLVEQPAKKQRHHKRKPKKR